MKKRKWIGPATVSISLFLLSWVGCSKEGDSGYSAPTTGMTGVGSGQSIGPAASPIEPTLDQGWCGGHRVPESVCTRCNASLIPRFKEGGDWCAEHGIPESQCVVCHPEVEAEWARLNPAAKKETPPGDASGAKLDANQPRYGRVLPDNSTDMRIERVTRRLTGANDPLCQVEDFQVRFIDPSISQKAGIEVQRVRRRPMSATIVVPAQVEFDATHVTRTTPRLPGLVLDVPVNIGAEVAVDDLLAVVDSPVLGEAKSQYIERAQNLWLAEADLTRADTIFGGVQRMLEVCTPDAQPEHVRETLAESPVGDAKAKLLGAHAALQLARSVAAREATLLEKELTSERDYQAARSALAAAEADFVAIREEIAFSVERKRLTAERALTVAKSALESAKRRLHILGLDEEQIGMIGTEPYELLSRFELRSSVAGRVVERTVSVGESVEATDVLFVVADLSTMWLMADLNEHDLVRMRTGLSVFFTVDGMPGVSFEGEVVWISSEVDDRTRTVRVRSDLPNTDGLLRANMFGRARIVLHDNDEVVTVPAEAVQTDGCCQLVFVRKSETVFQPRKIVLGASANGVAEVLKGLEEGEVVASTGSFLMKTEILKSNIGAGCCEVDPGR